MPVTNYIWDGQQYLMEADDGNVTQAVWTNETDEYTNLISQRRGGATKYPHFDALGSTRQLTDAGENITDTWSYDAWGNVFSRIGTTIFPLQFVGMVGYFYDPDTNTFYVIHRIYESDRGRWYSIDSLWPAVNINGYLYAANNPLRFHDPSGLQLVLPELEKFDPDKLFADPPLPKTLELTDEQFGEFVCSSQQSWSKDLCNKCPPCPCTQTMFGTQIVTEEQLTQLFNEIKNEMGVTCPVQMTTQAECVPKLPGFALTCSVGTQALPSVIMCFPTTLSYCQTRALVIHEMVHAKQICDRIKKGLNAKESEAYRNQCEDLQAQKCLDQKPSEMDKEIRACVSRLTPQSTNAENIKLFKDGCANLKKLVK